MSNCDILIVTPAPPRSLTGNRVTALRWARILRRLGCRVRITQYYASERCDLLIALHARKSYPSLARFHRQNPHKPIVLALTGTDLYSDLRINLCARQALEWADRLVVLQAKGVEEIPPRFREKTTVIVQSVPNPRQTARPSPRDFNVCVIGHLRPVKDPFRAARASRSLPPESRIRILHLGSALTASMEQAAQDESKSNPRYTWMGGLPHWKTMRILARCRLMVMSSRMEGGANAICEALAYGVPILSSRISGSVGLLGPEHPGYFPVGDTRALVRLLLRAERDPVFYRRLQSAGANRRHIVNPKREAAGWKSLIEPLLKD